MNLKAALLATATAGALLLVPACGGDAGPSPAGNVTGGASAGSITSAQYVAIDLNSTYAYTAGYGIGDGEQTGVCICGGGDYDQAVLWRGSSSNPVQLHPKGFIDSYAFATSGGVQVGSGRPPGSGRHALKWAGSASSVVDLDPTGFWAQS